MISILQVKDLLGLDLEANPQLLQGYSTRL